MDTNGNLTLPEVMRLVASANAARLLHDVPDAVYNAGSEVESRGISAEQRLDSLFKTSHRLAVYGSLAPGRPNHHIVAPLGGEWENGLVEGDLVPVGWGAALGYPAFRPRVGGSAIPVQMLTSPLLATAWPSIDSFEGSEYQRILVPVLRPVPEPVSDKVKSTEASPEHAEVDDGEVQIENSYTLYTFYTVANLYAVTGSKLP